MTQFLSDTDSAQTWLNQFENIQDRSNATKLLNSLKYISNRDFENFIYEKLDDLYNTTHSRLAVYPVVAPLPNNIAGSKLFTGNFKEYYVNNTAVREDGRRIQYGSEDRVGHILKMISRQHRGYGSVSNIECCPTIQTIIKQGIKNIVFVDDICGSGKRFIDFFKKEIPPELKRYISIHKVKIWFVCYGITLTGLKHIKSKIKFFKNNPDNIISKYIPLNFDNILSDKIKDLCFKYTRKNYGNDSASLGYKNSIGGIVFEHGCPNNLPRILWDNNINWKALFKNRSIPPDLKPKFSEENLIDTSEVLWDVNQKNLAIAIFDSIETNRIEPKYNLIFTLIGLINRGINSKTNLAHRLFIGTVEINQLIEELIESNLIILENETYKTTALANAILKKFKKVKLKKINSIKNIDFNKNFYYPSQCDGHFRFLVDC